MSHKGKRRRKKWVERYHQIYRMDKNPRIWLSSQIHSQRVRNNSHNFQKGKMWSFIEKDVSQGVWLHTEAGHPETVKFPCWGAYRPWLRKALRNLTSLCIKPNFRRRWDQPPLGVPTNLLHSPSLDEKCTTRGFFFIPLSVMLGCWEP